MIPLCTPTPSEHEVKYLREAVLAGDYCDGPHKRKFADALCDWTGKRYCVLTDSGTSALELAIRVWGQKEVIVPDWTFVATANAAMRAGCRVGISSHNNMDYRLIAVPLLGCASPTRVAVSDCCQALGNPLCFEGPEICAVSFNANKIITAGGGGAVLTDDQGIAEYAEHLAGQARMPNGYYHSEPSGNFRMSNIQAAVGLAQMETITQRVARKKEIHAIYSEHGLDMMDDCTFLSVMKHERAHEVVAELNRRGIGAQNLWVPLHMLGACRDCDQPDPAIKVSSYHAWMTTLALPCSVSMPDELVAKCALTAKEVMENQRSA